MYMRGCVFEGSRLSFFFCENLLECRCIKTLNGVSSLGKMAKIAKK